MKCVICKHGETVSGTATVTLEREGVTVVFKDVPARVCQNCGEKYFEEDVTENLLQVLDESVKNGVQIDIRKYFAA